MTCKFSSVSTSEPLMGVSCSAESTEALVCVTACAAGRTLFMNESGRKTFLIHSQLSNSMPEAMACACSALRVMPLRNSSTCSLTSTACSAVSRPESVVICEGESATVARSVTACTCSAESVRP